jgi:nitroreductase
LPKRGYKESTGKSEKRYLKVEDVMEILEAVKERRSIRNFQKKEIPRDLLDKLIDALLWAPSAGNLQARKFYFIQDTKLKGEIVSAALGQGFIAEAPLVIVACTDNMISGRYGDRGVNLYAIEDVAASIMGMMLVAHENRLGTVWVGAFREDMVIEILDLPHNLRPVAIVPVGYPSRIPSPPPRVSRQSAVEFR